MSKRKIFGDLKVGDTIWIADLMQWKQIPVKIIKIEESIKEDFIWIYFEKGNLQVRTHSYYNTSLKGGVYVNLEDCLEEMLIRAKTRELEYIREIDRLISEYDALHKFVLDNEKV